MNKGMECLRPAGLLAVLILWIFTDILYHNNGLKIHLITVPLIAILLLISFMIAMFWLIAELYLLARWLRQWFSQRRHHAGN